jgi:hypothetical protein
MRLLVAVITAISLLSMPSFAQKGGGGGKKKDASQAQKTDDRNKAASKLEKDYKAALDSIPNKPPNDPWAGVRQAPKAK